MHVTPVLTQNGNGVVHLDRPYNYTPQRNPEVNTVVLCGHAPTSRELATFNLPDVDYWSMNDSFAWIGMVGSHEGKPQLRYRMDRYFELHHSAVYRNPARRTGGYIDFLKTFPGPVMMQEIDPEIPTSQRYPLEAAVALAGRASMETQAGPFGSSFGWMIALAILEGYKRIEMYGCDLSANEEYRSQRPATYYWIGRCDGMGIEFKLPDATPLLNEPFYGRNITVAPGVSKDEVMNRLAHLRNVHGQASKQAVLAEGAMSEAAHWATRLGVHR